VLIKLGLKDIPALTFAGLRYTLAFLCLLPFATRAGHVTTLCRLSIGAWLRLIVLGVLLSSVTRGAQFLSLFYLPAVTTSLLLSFTTIVVALLGLAWLNERPTWMQWSGTALYLVGVLVYFYPAQIPAGEVIGLIVAGVCVLGNALSTILGRRINRGGTLEPMTVTIVSMGIGSVILLASGIAVQGLPRLTIMHWGIIAWLAAVNSALAYTLWNRTLRATVAQSRANGSHHAGSGSLIALSLLATSTAPLAISQQKPHLDQSSVTAPKVGLLPPIIQSDLALPPRRVDLSQSM
jgi:drug/metabolite transporter (DMT)-like permease